MTEWMEGRVGHLSFESKANCLRHFRESSNNKLLTSREVSGWESALPDMVLFSERMTLTSNWKRKRIRMGRSQMCTEDSGKVHLSSVGWKNC